MLTAVHERAFNRPGAAPFAAVLTQASAWYGDAAVAKLGIAKLVWSP